MTNLPRALLIDDDEGLVVMLERLLSSKLGDSVALTAMSDSVAAKRWVQENRPEIVVTDLEMPAIDGFEMVEAARRANPDATIVVFSGRAEELKDRLSSYGIYEYIEKSWEFQQLEDAVLAGAEKFRLRSTRHESQASRPIRGVAQESPHQSDQRPSHPINFTSLAGRAVQGRL